MTTIDEALAEVQAEVRQRDGFAAQGYRTGVTFAQVSVEALRTLLAHTADYDALKGRLEEAVRELEPLVAATEAEYTSEATADDPDDGKVSYPEDRCNITFGMIRRARRFLDREKEAGRG